jgi:hypothetical protein
MVKVCASLVCRGHTAQFVMTVEGLALFVPAFTIPPIVRMMPKANLFPVASGVVDEVVGNGSGRKSVNGLVQQVDDLLVNRPGPGRCPDTGHVPQSLIVSQPEIEEDEGRHRSLNSALRHQRPHSAQRYALTPVHRPVQSEPLAVRPDR